MPVEVRIVEDFIPEVVARVNATSRAAVKACADDIARDMRAYAPVDTGAMRDSIESQSNVAGFDAEVHIGEDYWFYPNYGTRFQAAQPFVEPAIDNHVDDVPEKILVALEVGYE